MNGKWKGLVLLAALGALAGLAGCSHSCVPDGWYGAHSVAPPRQPPGAPPITHATTYDIPGGAPSAKPSSDQACLVYPPNTLTTAPPAKAGKKGGQ
ncbi:MAG: hypothetical protein ACRER1_05270 [Gammaproteobacteria bacterium]